LQNLLYRLVAARLLLGRLKKIWLSKNQELPGGKAQEKPSPSFNNQTSLGKFDQAGRGVSSTVFSTRLDPNGDEGMKI
jgi:hypothetical protein